MCTKRIGALAPTGNARTRALVAGVALGACLLVAGGTGAATSPYVAVDLGTLGGSSSHASAVNESGQVVGSSNTSKTASGYEPEHAFSWTQGGGMVDLGTLGGISSAAVAVNDSGQVVGSSSTGSPRGGAFSWTQAGGMIDLDSLSNGSAATAVSNSGQVVGSLFWYAGDYQPVFSWTQAGGMINFGVLGGTYPHGYFASPTAVNESGQVVGTSTTDSGDRHAFLWTQAGRLGRPRHTRRPRKRRRCGERQRPGRRLRRYRKRAAARVLVDAGWRHGRSRHPRRHQQQLRDGG